MDNGSKPIDLSSGQDGSTDKQLYIEFYIDSLNLFKATPRGFRPLNTFQRILDPFDLIKEKK